MHTRIPGFQLPLPARVLAIDYGRRRLGLAVSDELGITAHTLPVLSRTNRRMDMARLRKLIKEEKIQLIIVGCPVHLSGRTSEMAEESQKFAAWFRKEFGLPVEMRDERLTSWEAQQISRELGLEKNAEIDSIAAAILLREYLNEAHASSESKSTVPERCEK